MDENATKYLEAIAGSLIDQHLIIGLTQRSRFIIFVLSSGGISYSLIPHQRYKCNEP